MALRDKVRGLKGSCDTGVKIDHSIVLLSESLVSLLAAIHHPLLEGLPNPRVDDVADVGAGHLPDLTEDGQ